jgi:ParB family transcriptional regulator, chromosome partitioning protein
VSIKNRMKELSTAILAETKASQQGGAAVVDQAPEKSKQPGGTATAPGGMLAFRSQLQKHEETVRGLETQLSQYQGSVRTVKLDADLIDVSKWANRHATSFESAAFEELKEEIAHAGGNVQPILVRPNGTRYEVVFGHRRLAACKHLGIPVLAMVMALSDEELFTLMDRENRHREDLSPLEQGVMWARAIDEGLFPSARQLASHVGVSPAFVSQCLAIARLPDFVAGLFRAPTEIQIRWAKALQQQLQADPEAVAARADQIKAIGRALPSVKVFEMLIGADTESTLKPSPVKQGGRVIGKIGRGHDGGVILQLNAGSMSEQAFEQLRLTVSRLVGT